MKNIFLLARLSLTPGHFASGVRYAYESNKITKEIWKGVPGRSTLLRIIVVPRTHSKLGLRLKRT